MEEKTREEILAERKLRKLAKQSKKQAVNKQEPLSEIKTKKTISDLNKDLNKMKISPHSQGSTSKLNAVTPEKESPVSCLRNQISEATGENSTKSEKEERDLTEKSNDTNTCDSSASTDAKTKAQLKAERRAKQEAQRTLKAQKKTEENVVDRSKAPKPDVKPANSRKKIGDNVTKENDTRKIKLFSHLYRNTSVEECRILANCSTDIHKAVIKLGLQYKNKIIIGSNARVVALLNTLKQVISDYKTPAEKDFSRGFEMVLADIMIYLSNCRPASVSMTNAVKFLKSHLTQLPNNISDHEAQVKLREAIDDYLKEQIDMAGKAICITVQKKISQNDVILTFGYSSLIERILIESFQVGIKFRVVIVDAGPLFEGKELLRRLVRNGLECIYVLLSAISFIMKEADKVLLGAHALLTNGYVMSRAGSSLVALIAKSYNVPVLVCCETHKFSERVQTDAFVHNELGDSDKLMDPSLWKSNRKLTPLTLMYEVTPSDLVTAVVTELAILPCTSVPVVLRVKPASSSLG